MLPLSPGNSGQLEDSHEEHQNNVRCHAGYKGNCLVHDHIEFLQFDLTVHVSHHLGLSINAYVCFTGSRDQNGFPQESRPANQADSRQRDHHHH